MADIAKVNPTLTFREIIAQQLKDAVSQLPQVDAA